MLPVWLMNPWTRRIGAVAAIGIALWWYGARQRAQGRAEGQQQAGAEWSQELEKARAADRAETEKQLQRWESVYQEAQARAAAAESLGRELARAVASIQQQRTQAVHTVSALPDSGLRPYIIQTLGLRAVGDDTPGFIPSEERAIAKCVADQPLCAKQVETQREQIAKLEEGQAAQQDQIAALNQKYDALADYSTRLEATYTAIWNAWPRKRRSPKCLWIWKCGKGPKIPTPDPETLKPVREEKP